jgi:hypothetical protein
LEEPTLEEKNVLAIPITSSTSIENVVTRIVSYLDIS